MSSLEGALVILVSVWSIIFIVLGVAVFIILRQIKKALDKINHILSRAEEVTEGVGTVSKIATASMAKWLLNKQTKKLSK